MVVLGHISHCKGWIWRHQRTSPFGIVYPRCRTAWIKLAKHKTCSHKLRFQLFVQLIKDWVISRDAQNVRKERKERLPKRGKFGRFSSCERIICWHRVLELGDLRPKQLRNRIFVLSKRRFLDPEEVKIESITHE